MAVVHPIDRAWLSAGGTGAQNYDEFADEAEITSIIESNPRSALAIEMPHRAPESQGSGFAAALPAAVNRLAAAKQAGAYRPAERVVVLYRISEPAGATSYGMFCMVDTDQISSRAGEPGLVIRNEDVFEEKVRERVALAEATGHLLSPVLLLASASGPRLAEALSVACEQAGPSAVSDLDQAGRRHEIWPLADGETARHLLALAGQGELVVADGNHRTLAAQVGGLRRFLAVITAPGSAQIAPYNRLVTEFPFPASQLADRIVGVGGALTAATAADPPGGGVVHLYTGGQTYAVRLPADPAADAVANLDHALVERVLVRGALELDPGDKRVTYVGGDYPTTWLRGEVDAGRAQAAVIIAPVTVEDFMAVNLARHKMPRKSTWFTPKARAGLVLAQLD